MALNSSIHKNIMTQIIKDIYSDTSISPFLGFKGGTAAFMFYGLSRFSTDLDFDLLDSAKENFVFEKIEKIVKNYGKIKELKEKRFSLFFLLSYEDKAHNIKLEINRREFGSKYEIKTYLGISMPVMVPEDMFAHKLMAMNERIGKTNRDISNRDLLAFIEFCKEKFNTASFATGLLNSQSFRYGSQISLLCYDVWFFLKNNWPINKAIVEKRAKMSYEKFLQKCLNDLEKMNNRGILNGIGELLDTKQKNWAKENLLKDTVFLLKIRMENEK